MPNAKAQQPAAFERRALSIGEACQIAGLSRATVYRLISARKLDTVRVLGRRLVWPESIDALLREGA